MYNQRLYSQASICSCSMHFRPKSLYFALLICSGIRIRLYCAPTITLRRCLDETASHRCRTGPACGNQAAQAADPNLARNLAATCANCHGTNGKAVPGAGMDALAGMDKAKTLQKLAEFKSGDKPASIMHQISRATPTSSSI
jgi:cytochrome c553